VREIPLGRGYTAVVDDEDYEQLSRHKWYVYDHRENRSIYARRVSLGKMADKKHVSMHREIMGFPDSPVDHINGNGLDNRRCNLRLCSHSGNSQNRRPNQKPTASGYKGVWWRKKGVQWEARIRADGKEYRLGYFKDSVAAARAYNDAAVRLHGEFAQLNVIPDLFDPDGVLVAVDHAVVAPKMGKPTGSKVMGRPRIIRQIVQKVPKKKGAPRVINYEMVNAMVIAGVSKKDTAVLLGVSLTSVYNITAAHSLNTP
jgi:hypothetical protein